MQVLNILLQSSAPSGSWNLPIMMLGIFIIMYFFMIRPQAKKAKQQKQFINDLQKGDKVVTIAGIHGKINKVLDDNTIELEVSPGSYIKMEKSAISLEWSAGLNKPAEVK